MRLEGSVHRGVQDCWDDLTEAAPAGLASLAGGCSTISLYIILERLLNLLNSVSLSSASIKVRVCQKCFKSPCGTDGAGSIFLGQSALGLRIVVGAPLRDELLFVFLTQRTREPFIRNRLLHGPSSLSVNLCSLRRTLIPPKARLAPQKSTVRKNHKPTPLGGVVQAALYLDNPHRDATVRSGHMIIWF